MRRNKKAPSNQQGPKIVPTYQTNYTFFRTTKYKNYQADKLAVTKYLADKEATATMVSVELGIYRPSMCRIKRELEKMGLLHETRIGICEVTGFRAAFLTTDPKKVKGGKNGR